MGAYRRILPVPSKAEEARSKGTIGEPTGNAPSSYGDSPSFQMPMTGFQFTVSIKKWTRPDKNSDLEDSLYPDVLVYTTIEDIKQGRDPQLEKLKEMIRNMEK